MMKEEQLYALIEQELRGTLEGPDARALADWKGRGSQEETAYQEIRSILEITSEGIATIDPQTDDSWLALQAVLGSEEEAEESKVEEAEAPVIQMDRRPRTRIYGIADTVILLVIAGLYFGLPGGGAGTDGGDVFASSHGEIKKVNLPDGSVVTLSPESQLALSADFNDEMRRVELEGEAFFDIARNEEKPFVIEVMGTETRVLGTSFNISAYAATEQVVVSVLTGKVRFEPIGGNAHLELTPNQMGRFDLKTRKLSRGETAAADDAAWQDGKLVFRKIPLRIALERLEKHYELEFEVGPKLENEPLTSTIDTNKDNEEDVISLLETTFQVQVERAGKRIKIMR